MWYIDLIQKINKQVQNIFFALTSVFSVDFFYNIHSPWH